MLENNYKIEKSLGEYKDYPYSYTLYLYEQKVWTGDFSEPLSDKQVIETFIDDLREQCL